jgi:hypothetical protein
MISVKPQYVQQQQVQHAAITKLTREDVYDMLLRAHSSDAIRLRGVDLVRYATNTNSSRVI